MIKNGSFEEGWEDLTRSIQRPNHWRLRYTNGEPTVRKPENRDEWWVTGIPEVVHKTREQLEPHEPDLFGLGGTYILKVFKSHKALDVSLEQDITLELGAHYTFKVPVYVDVYDWENGKEVPTLHPDDPEKRAGSVRLLLVDGETIVAKSKYFDEGSVRGWYLNRHVLEWTFQAPVKEATLAVEFYNPWPMDNNGWFTDGLSLIKKDSGPNPPDDSGPRVQYKRVYNVVTDKSRAREVLEKTWPQTIGPSYDDAGLGALDDKTAVLWDDIPQEKRQEYKNWYETHYSGTTIVFKSITNDSGWEEYLLAQGDPEWGDRVYAEGQCYPLKNQGCFITACAMAQRILGIDEDATPVSVDETLGAEGYDRCLLKHSAMRTKLGLDILYSNEAGAIEHVQEGGIAFLEVAPSSLMHFVVGVEYKDGDWLVLDPWKNTVDWVSNLYEGVESARIITKKDVSPPNPKPQNLISFHAQANESGLIEYVRDTRPAVFKAVNDLELLRQVKQVSPETKTIYRKHVSNQAPYYRDMMAEAEGFGDTGLLNKLLSLFHLYNSASLLAEPESGAKRFFDFVHPELVEYSDVVDYCEGINEEVGTGCRDKNLKVVRFETEFAKLLGESGLAKPCVLNVAVGNPGHDEVEDLVPAARMAYQYDGVVGYHSYWPTNREQSWLINEGQHFAWRWIEWAKVFAQHDVYPLFALTEGGPIGGNLPYNLNAGAGWRHSSCLNGNWEMHKDQLRTFIAKAEGWNATHGNRLLGLCLFTVGRGMNWEWFEYWQEQLNDLARS